ncbi:hypothetical protein DPMN_120256 [Dreissena polymorpha]|uniref:Uncharacterized protein n=1 Tax=Dreissena polymorpha TaxID=45954 RepID=A0A9D4GNM1_DREPO|nr:hypothetical protein DPMN_120256 [Dreissena polymorpha]
MVFSWSATFSLCYFSIAKLGVCFDEVQVTFARSPYLQVRIWIDNTPRRRDGSVA